jgi:NAD(P)H-dependent FMN reductase
MKILAISGSRRAASSNTALLEAAKDLTPSGVNVELWPGMGLLPHFNPDLDVDDPADLPPPVRDLRQCVGDADALLFSTPEYAHGLPGSFKNALDWLVRSTEFPGKAAAIMNPSARSVHAQEQLLLVLSTMSARLTQPPTFTIQLPRRDMTAADIVADPALAAAIRLALTHLGHEARTANGG